MVDWWVVELLRCVERLIVVSTITVDAICTCDNSYMIIDSNWYPRCDFLLLTVTFLRIKYSNIKSSLPLPIAQVQDLLETWAWSASSSTSIVTRRRCILTDPYEIAASNDSTSPSESAVPKAQSSGSKGDVFSFVCKYCWSISHFGVSAFDLWHTRSYAVLLTAAWQSTRHLFHTVLCYLRIDSISELINWLLYLLQNNKLKEY